MKARHIQEGRLFDYKNEGSTKISVGDIVVIGTKATVAAIEIEVGETGTVAAGEVYDVVKDANAIDLGAKVYYDTSAGNATATEKDVEMGYAIAAAAAGDTTVRVKLMA